MKIEDQTKNTSLQKAEDCGTRQTASQKLGHAPRHASFRRTRLRREYFIGCVFLHLF
jgi:hypothetical protein